MRLYWILLLFLTVVVFSSNKGGRNQPTTGAPFENSGNACAQCHAGGNFTPTISLTIKDSLGNVVDKYKANDTYTLEMKIGSTTGNPQAYGFQAVLVDEANAQAGSFTTLGEKVRKLTLQNRVYLTQISPLASGLYTAKWKAPETAKNLKLYIAGLATNNNGGTSGDKGTFTSFNIAPVITSNIEENPAEALSIRVQGNILSWNIEADQAILYDAWGRMVSKASGTEMMVPFAVPGFYILQHTRGKNSKSLKIIL